MTTSRRLAPLSGWPPPRAGRPRAARPGAQRPPHGIRRRDRARRSHVHDILGNLDMRFGSDSARGANNVGRNVVVKGVGTTRLDDVGDDTGCVRATTSCAHGPSRTRSRSWPSPREVRARPPSSAWSPTTKASCSTTPATSSATRRAQGRGHAARATGRGPARTGRRARALVAGAGRPAAGTDPGRAGARRRAGTPAAHVPTRAAGARAVAQLKAPTSFPP